MWKEGLSDIELKKTEKAIYSMNLFEMRGATVAQELVYYICIQVWL